MKRAVIDGEPLTERVVTLTGESVSRPGNIWARLGTPVRHLLEQAGFCPGSDQLVIMGGPLMGFTLPWLDVPVVKITNCLLAPSLTEMGETQEEKVAYAVAPVRTHARQIYCRSSCIGTAKASCTIKPGRITADCIECGACARVCPSNIPLVQYFRQEKAEIYAISMEEKRAAEAKARFEARGRDWSARNKPVRNAISRLPCSLRRKIRMPLTQPRPAYARRKPPPPRRL